MFPERENKIAGVDEAGRGPLAGPIVAAAVIIEHGDFKDSKKLTAKARAKCYREIISNALAVSVAAVPPHIIDALDIRKATLLAMRNAVVGLEIAPAMVLIDGRDEIPLLAVPQRAIIDGDASISVIAAASIVAKVARDALMKAYSNRFRNFDFGKHKGYGTKQHYSEIDAFGETIIHRLSFRLR